jgi:hypothetical protein
MALLEKLNLSNVENLWIFSLVLKFKPELNSKFPYYANSQKIKEKFKIIHDILMKVFRFSI